MTQQNEATRKDAAPPVEADTPLQQSGASLVEDVAALRRREVQAIGAAISTRCWQSLEAAYNQLRDKLDRPEWITIPARDGIEAQHGLNDVFPGDPVKVPALATPLPVDAGGGLITAELLGEVMQDAWGEICDDTQAHPEDIRRDGRKLFYQHRHWTDLIALRLNEALASPPVVGPTPAALQQGPAASTRGDREDEADTAADQWAGGHYDQLSTSQQQQWHVFRAGYLAAPTKACREAATGGGAPDVSGLRGAEKLAHLMAWYHFGLKWGHMERQSQLEVLTACQKAIDWFNLPVDDRNAALTDPQAAAKEPSDVR